MYGDRFKEVMAVTAALRNFGIYYYDVKPKNVEPPNWNPTIEDDKEEYGEELDYQ